MYFTSGSDRAFEQLMQTRPGADHFDSGEAGAPEDCGTCRFYRPHWKYQFCVYEECPYQPGKLTALDGAVKFQVKGVDDEMAVFRVEKNRGYTVMSNHHLRNKDLSLKAKGLLSQMLSLPEDWDFTLKGLSLINREQIDAIRAAVRELEQAGYIVRSRERDSQGRLRGADYIIYEQPQPVPDSPTLENPTLDNPTQEKPTQEKPTQLNKDRSSKEKSITDGSNTDSIPILSPPSPLGEEAAAPPERKGTGAKSQSAVEIYREIIKDNIEYVKSHHYIISFDPRDGTDNGLTVDRAQELGEQFCKAHFPGHQALVCTHPDGHNHSGNIHVHIVINSLRIYEVPLLPYMDRPADTREGCKHRCTNAAMEYFKSEVMEMCHREGLYQIDLLNGSKERITEREYWAAKKGQLALDKENAAREAAGQPTKPTKFETDKAKLRRTIRQALSQAGSFDEFASLLLREGVTVKESRGRLSYLTPDRTKPITARKLGDDFDKAAVLALLTQNAHRAAEKPKAIPEYPHTQKGRLQEEKAAKTTPADNTLQRMVDREAKRAEGKGVGYDRWAAKYNLKQMAATVTAYQQYGFSSPEELDEACSAAYTAMRESLTELKQVEKTLDGKKELQRQVLAYSKTRPVRDGLKQQKNAKAKAAYRQKYESDFIIADAAARYFRENGISKLPSYKALQAEIESLIKEKNSGYNDYRAKREEYRRLQTVKGNIDQILRRERKPVKRQEQER